MEMNEEITFALASYLICHARDFVAGDAEVNRRMEICKNCDKMEIIPPATEEEEKEELMERFGKTEPFHGCTLCGCMLESKAEFFFERCPEMKWYPRINFTEVGMWETKEQPGDLEQWKKYHEEFMKLYEERGKDFMSWFRPRNYGTIEGESNNE